MCVINAVKGKMATNKNEGISFYFSLQELMLIALTIHLICSITTNVHNSQYLNINTY